MARRDTFAADDLRRVNATERRAAAIGIEVPELEDPVVVERIVTERPVVDTPYKVTIGNDALDALLETRHASLTKVYTTLGVLREDLRDFFPQVPQPLPESISGTLVLPDGSPGALLSVEVPRPQYTDDEDPGDVPWATPRTITDERGAFSLRLPTVPLPKSGIALAVRGEDGGTSIAVTRTDLLEPRLGVLTLDRRLRPLPRSALAQLIDVVPVDAEDVADNPEVFAEPEPTLYVGSPRRRRTPTAARWWNRSSKPA